jgi:predicted HAD superfamily Cof-like phosphohydrolase
LKKKNGTTQSLKAMLGTDPYRMYAEHDFSAGAFWPRDLLIKNNKFKQIIMNNPNTLELVKEFHDTFEHPVLEAPEIPSEKRSALRVSLITEELKELEQAIKDGNLVEVADALCDLQYVLSGTILEFGLGDRFKELFNEVHRSNMSKACYSPEDAMRTVLHYDGKGEPAKSVHKESMFIVQRVSDGKLLKSIKYSPANLKQFL